MGEDPTVSADDEFTAGFSENATMPEPVPGMCVCVYESVDICVCTCGLRAWACVYLHLQCTHVHACKDNHL